MARQFSLEDDSDVNLLRNIDPALCRFRLPDDFIEACRQKHELSLAAFVRLWISLCQFLTLKTTYLAKRNTLSPSPAVDKLWHELILWTRLYSRLGGALGGFVHHDPLRVHDAEGYYANTLQLLKEHFGDRLVWQDYWPNYQADNEATGLDPNRQVVFNNDTCA